MQNIFKSEMENVKMYIFSSLERKKKMSSFIEHIILYKAQKNKARKIGVIYIYHDWFCELH